MNDQKPGFQTSEFWAMLGAQVISILTLTGVLNPVQAHVVGDALAQASPAIFALIASASTVTAYIASRTTVKTNN